jgi:glycosyltransferase involved in cell wall biosynthesis
LAKRCERWFFRVADAIVTLTHASIPQVRAWAGPREVPIAVIPTCVDIKRFADTEARPDGPHLTWCGSIGTWYRFDLVPRLASALGYPLDVVTRQRREASVILDGMDADVRELPPEQVPSAMHPGDIGLSLCVPAFSKLASAPTRFAEHLAAGMPVIVTRGIGDLEAIVEARQVGVVLDGDEDAALLVAASATRALLADPELADRCRRAASDLFDVDAGARLYAELYDQLAR